MCRRTAKPLPATAESRGRVGATTLARVAGVPSDKAGFLDERYVDKVDDKEDHEPGKDPPRARKQRFRERSLCAGCCGDRDTPATTIRRPETGSCIYMHLFYTAVSVPCSRDSAPATTAASTPRDSLSLIAAVFDSGVM